MPEELPVHIQQAGRRAKNIGHIPQFIPLFPGYAVQPRGREPFLRQAIGTVIGIIAVSYTHLDVYKRQIQYGRTEDKHNWCTIVM